LRDYQREAVQAVINREIAGYKAPAGIIHLPPRSGKTLIAAAIIDQFWMARPAVFVVERVDLARQSQLAISDALGEAVGIVGDGVADIKPITIITIQSLHAAYNIKYEKIASDDVIEKGIANKVAVIKMLSTAQVIVIDEMQHAVSDGYINALRQAQNAFCVVGLSGTPWVDDGADLLLENACGPVVYKKTYSWMIEQGYLLPLDIYFYRLPPIMCYSGSYSSVYKSAVVDSPVKNGCIKRITEEFVRMGKSVAILTVYKNHAKTLHEMIKGSVMLTGDERGLYRHQVYQQLNRKEVKVIISTVFSEGIDVPSLDVGINADGGKDSRRIFQRLRMQTPHPGKTRGIYVDFLHEEKYLRDHANRRLSFYEQERLFKVHIRDPRLELKLAYPNVGLE
jgi:superfamily II DNA or RNA helicase